MSLNPYQPVTHVKIMSDCGACNPRTVGTEIEGSLGTDWHPA